MLDKITDFINSIEPLILVLIPLIMGFWMKVKTKVLEEQIKLTNKDKEYKEQQLTDYKHEASIKVIGKLKEVCNYYCDLSHVHASYIQLENGTIATSKLCNMFFSCIAEDNRYFNLTKLIDTIQRVPFIRLSNWFNKVYNSDYNVVYINDEVDIDSILYDTSKVKCMISSLVRDYKGLVIGVCNFVFSEEQDIDDLNTYKTQMLKFVSSIETVFLDYNINIKNKANELELNTEGGE